MRRTCGQTILSAKPCFLRRDDVGHQNREHTHLRKISAFRLCKQLPRSEILSLVLTMSALSTTIYPKHLILSNKTSRPLRFTLIEGFPTGSAAGPEIVVSNTGALASRTGLSGLCSYNDTRAIREFSAQVFTSALNPKPYITKSHGVVGLAFAS